MFIEKRPIGDLTEVVLFAAYLYFDLKVNFHPHDDFAQYVNATNHKPTFSLNRAERLNQRMRECCEVCEKCNVDVCDVMNIAEPYIEAIQNGMIPNDAKLYAVQTKLQK